MKKFVSALVASATLFLATAAHAGVEPSPFREFIQNIIFIIWGV